MKVAVLVGGPSSEAHVSRASGASTAEALRARGHEVVVLELLPEVARRLLEEKPDVVFPVTHGELGEDGCVQGLLEVLGLPYVGSDVRASAIASHKVLSKMHFALAGLPLARQWTVRRGETDVLSLEEVRQRLGAAFVVKPPSGGSTIGVSRVLAGGGEVEFREALTLGFEFEEELLLEAYVVGAEVTCGVLETDDGPVALPPTLILSEASDWYDFRSKYGAGGSRHLCPAPFDSDVRERIGAAALAAHAAVGARDLSRTDFIVAESGEFVVLEINNLPGMTKVSLFPEAAAVFGLDFPALTDHLVRRAFARGGGRPDRALALPSLDAP